jgi:tape measure domain-containing protein
MSASTVAMGGIMASGIMGIANAVVGFGSEVVKAAANIEMLESDFGVMLGSVEEGKQLFQDIKKMGNITPFSTDGLANATKTLLQFGVEGEKVIPTMSMLGDVAMGNEEKLKGLSVAYGQVQSQGKLMGQDLMQMINNGFNPLKVISDKTGESMASLKEKMSKGAISADMVTQAFIDATSEGGQFFGGMEAGSKTLLGKFSTLKDTFMNLFTEKGIGNAGMNFFKRLIDNAQYAIDWLTTNFEKLKEVFAPVIEIIDIIIQGWKNIFGELGSAGDMLSGVFNMIAGILKVISFFLKPLIKAFIWIAELVADWIIKPFVKFINWIAKIAGFKTIKFEEPKSGGLEAYSKSIQDQKMGLLDGKTPTSEMTTAKKTSSKASSVGSIAGGKPTSVVINIDSLIKENVNQVNNVNGDGLQKFEKMLTEALLRVVNDSQIAIQ